MQRLGRRIASDLWGRSVYRHESLRHNQPMPDLGEFTDGELFARAHEWRRRALHGDKDARGMAHALEAEIRRRVGNPKTSFAELDTRPLEPRSRPWWRFW